MQPVTARVLNKKLDLSFERDVKKNEHIRQEKLRHLATIWNRRRHPQNMLFTKKVKKTEVTVCGIVFYKKKPSCATSVENPDDGAETPWQESRN